MNLVVEYFDTPWSIPKRSLHSRGGGWKSVRSLQANSLRQCRCQTRYSWVSNPCRATKIERGVLVERRTDEGTWVNYYRLTLE